MAILYAHLSQSDQPEFEKITRAMTNHPELVAGKGYPGNPRSVCKLNDIVDIKYASELKIFHAGTYFENNFLRNSGGRIFSFTVRGKNLDKVRAIAYNELNKIQNENSITIYKIHFFY